MTAEMKAKDCTWLIYQEMALRHFGKVCVTSKIHMQDIDIDIDMRASIEHARDEILALAYCIYSIFCLERRRRRRRRRERRERRERRHDWSKTNPDVVKAPPNGQQRQTTNRRCKASVRPVSTSRKRRVLGAPVTAVDAKRLLCLEWLVSTIHTGSRVQCAYIACFVVRNNTRYTPPKTAEVELQTAKPSRSDGILLAKSRSIPSNLHVKSSISAILPTHLCIHQPTCTCIESVTPNPVASAHLSADAPSSLGIRSFAHQPRAHHPQLLRIVQPVTLITAEALRKQCEEKEGTMAGSLHPAEGEPSKTAPQR